MTRPHVVTLLSVLLITASACQSKEENPSNPPLELTDMAEAQSYSAIEAGTPACDASPRLSSTTRLSRSLAMKLSFQSWPSLTSQSADFSRLAQARQL